MQGRLFLFGLSLGDADFFAGVGGLVDGVEDFL